jgi:hypothetical protein
VKFEALVELSREAAGMLHSLLWSIPVITGKSCIFVEVGFLSSSGKSVYILIFKKIFASNTYKKLESTSHQR